MAKLEPRNLNIPLHPISPSLPNPPCQLKINLINRTPVDNRLIIICNEKPNVWPQTPLLSSSLYNYKLPQITAPQFTPKQFLSSSLPMAALTVAISSVKTECAKVGAVKAGPSFGPLRGRAMRGKTVKVRASLRENAMKMAAASAAGVALASSALVGSAAAMEVLMGSSDGSLVFLPKEFSVAAGETITFKNNAGFPHNIIFDEDAVPSGVDASTISMSEEDLLNAPGQTYTVKLEKPGTYSFYCSPHQGSGMTGTVTVN